MQKLTTFKRTIALSLATLAAMGFATPSSSAAPAVTDQASQTRTKSELVGIINGPVGKPSITPNAGPWGTYTWYLHRGTPVMWAREKMHFSHARGELLNSEVTQESGYLSPNSVEPRGAVQYENRYSVHRWTGSYLFSKKWRTAWGRMRVQAKVHTTDWEVNAYASPNGQGRWIR